MTTKAKPKKGLNLMEIGEEIRGLLEMIGEESEDGEVLDDGVMDLLKSLEMGFDKKALSTAAFILELESEAKAIKAREQALSKRRKSTEAKAERLRSWLKVNLVPGTKYKDDQVSIGWMKRENVLVLLDDLKPEELPEAYVRRVPEIDKVTLRADLEDGKEVLVERAGEKVSVGERKNQVSLLLR